MIDKIDFSEVLARHLDQLLTDAVNQRLGPGDWQLKDLEGRLSSLPFQVGLTKLPATVYFLDNEALLTVRYETRVEDGRIFHTITPEYP